MKYTQVHISFLNEIPKELKNYLIDVCSFLECMLNSKMFEKFVLEGNYTNGKNEMYLSNGQIYDLLKEHDWHFKINYFDKNVSGNRPMSQSGEVTNVRKWVLNDSLAENAATIAHEYAHTLDLDHKRGHNPYGSFSYYLQFEGEKLFRKYEGKISEPQKGKVLIERKRGFPFCFLKKLEWR